MTNFVIMNFMPKESYFNADNLDRKATEISQGLPTYNLNPRIPFSLQNSALLVLDMQRYFLEPSSHAYIPSARAILPGIQALVQAYHKLGLAIIFTRHTNSERDAGAMKGWWRDLIRENTPLSKLAFELEPPKGTVVGKSQYDAFYQTTLEEMLNKRSVRQVVISGVMTHLCCETTARSAFMRGFEVFFLIDGTATYTAEFHRAALVNLAHGFATLCKVNDILTEAKHAN
jgi:bifunctional isochorismate lyase/aryl carrier protein